MANLKLKELAQALNMHSDNKKEIVFGTYHGYDMYIKVSDYDYCFHYSINIPVSFTNPEIQDTISSALDKFRSDNPSITKASYEKNKLIITTVSNDKKVSSFQFMVTVLNQITDFAMKNDMVRCCEDCGTPSSPLTFVTAKNSIASLKCSVCKVGSTPLIQNNMDKSNVLFGILGSLIGALPGFIIWICLYTLNSIPIEIAALVSGLIVFGIFKGYDYLGGILDANGKIIGMFLSVVILTLAEYTRALVFFITDQQLSVSEALNHIAFSDIIDAEMIALYILSVAGALFINSKLSSHRSKNSKAEPF